MRLRYANAYSSGLWLAVGYYSPGCPDGGDWAKKGWWRLDPSASAIVLWTTNDYSTLYAEADDGAHWSGPYTMELPFEAFDWCWPTGSTNGEWVGMRLVHATNAWAPWVGTINLT
jgi:uncharacterized membrane protein